MKHDDLGFYHRGLGKYVYNDPPEMGNLFDDMVSAIKGSAQNVAQQQYANLQTQIANLPQAAKDLALKSFLDSPSGVAMTEQAKASWMANQVDKVKVIYAQNKTTINLALAGVAGLAVLLMVMRKPSRRQAVREKVVNYIPSMYQTAAPSAPAATANARRRRRRVYRKHARRV